MSNFKRRSPADLTAKLTELTGSKDFSDANEWKLTTDKSSNGSAVIRFLPAQGDEDTPFVKIFNHGFQVKGKWLVENCPTTLSDDCPICKANGELWNSGVDDDKEIARKRKRKLSYWANIVVIKDEAKPDNQGKVFKYRFGQKIMDKIVAASAADEDLGTAGMDVTCVFDGANFSLKSKKVSGFANYDDSKFGPAKELFAGDEDKLADAWEKMHDLKVIIAPKEFKKFAELEAKFIQVTGATKAIKSASEDLEDQVKTSPKVDIDEAGGSTDELDDLLNELDLG